ncbi:heterogeneous nuclear ribonucleoprotein U-like protein 2 [Phlebotomus argentipes]|uniref:heterogeneous nuclear ribonucleoprotein U-like protein 2 n=1 Tax=Phlebotomus argentipes TaxID=94469 RepID=UPI00289310D2|nr:heterogeneous nuclear ribonucleoprotein U-like protein 2 [Phlebotomus argentipes]
MDLSKLRVVDLKQELQNRGLDTKGVKAILISRLQAAIEAEGDVAEESESNDAEEVSDEGPEQDSVLPDDDLSGAQGVTTHSPSPEPSAPPVVVAEEAIAVDSESESEPEVITQVDAPMEEAPPAIQVAPVAPEASPEPETMSQEAPEEAERAEPMPQEEPQEPEEPIAPMEVSQEAQEEQAAEETTETPPEEDEEEEKEKKEDDSVDAYTENETMPMDAVEQLAAEEAKKEEPEAEKEDKKRRRSRSPSESESSRRRPRRDSQSANADDFMNIEDEPALPENPALSWVDSDLHLKISSADFCEGRTMSDGVLGLMWAGARATHGVKSGKVFYEVQLLQRNSRVSFPEEKNLFDLRCGWSTLATDLQLGEAENSFAYGGEGKKYHRDNEEDFGVKFTVGDVVGVYLDLESTPCKVQYTVNGEDQGVAFEFEKETLNDQALFPHVLTKNINFKVNFGQLENTLLSEFKPRKPQQAQEGEKKAKEEEKPRTSSQSESNDPKDEDWEEPKPENVETPAEEKKEEESTEEVAEEKPEQEAQEKVEEKPEEEAQEKMEVEEKEEEPEQPINRESLPDFVLIAHLPREELVEGHKRPETRKECEVIMMIGLPGAGKTHWVSKWNEENPEKRYNIIGDNYLYSRMTNRTKPSKAEKFNDMCNRSFTVLQELAQKRRRNYILDQTNVFASAQRRKMKGFGDFKRIAVIVIPDDEEYKRRVACKNEGGSKEIADFAVNEMKANYSLPTTDLGWFDEIKYVDLQDEAATKLVEDYNEKGRRALPQSIKRRPYDDYRDRRRRDYNYDRRWDRGGDRRDRWQPYGNPRGSSGWRPQPPRDYYGGGYDRRAGHDRWNNPQWVSGGGGGGGGGRRSNERDYRRDYGHRDYSRNRDRDSRSGRSGRDQDFRERRSDNRGGGGDNYGSRSSHSSSRSNRRDYSSSKRDSGSSSAMKNYSGASHAGMDAGAAMAAQGGASWGAGWAGQQQWPVAGQWGAQGWQQSGWNAGAQNWAGWNYGAAQGVNGAEWGANSWDVNQAVYTTNSCPNVDTTSDQTN